MEMKNNDVNLLFAIQEGKSILDTLVTETTSETIQHLKKFLDKLSQLQNLPASEEKQFQINELTNSLKHDEREILKMLLVSQNSLKTPDSSKEPYIPIKTSTFYAPTPKVNDALFSRPIRGQKVDKNNLLEGQPLFVDKNKKIKVVLQSFYMDEKKILPTTTNEYDRNVFNAVCTLIEAGNTTIIPSLVFETMTGKKGRNPKAYDKIIKSIEKMSTTRITLNYENQLNAWKKTNPNFDSDQITGVFRQVYLLPVEETVVVIGNHNVSGYELIKVPELYTYAKWQGQIASYPNYLLKDTLSNTDRNIVLKNYLLERIVRAKNKSKTTSADLTIKIDTLFNLCNIDDQNTVDNKNPIQIKEKEKVYRNRLNISAKKCLDALVKKSFIKSWTTIKSGKRLIAYKFEI
jgi:hypothetical protein